MFGALKELFECVLAPPPGDAEGAEDHRVRLATAVLLVEVMRADPKVSAVERAAVVAALRRCFALPDDELQQLLAAAERSQREAIDFITFTSALNDHFDDAQKLRVIEAMWQVAYADGQLAAHENHVMWRISDLLHIPHGAYIGAKMRAKAAAGVS